MRGKTGCVPIRTRIVAFLWDYALICGYLVLLFGLSAAAGPYLAPLFAANPWTAELSGFALITLPVCLYFACTEGAGRHASWGKRKAGIRVAGAGGRPVGFARSLGRSALKFLPWELAHFSIWHMTLPSPLPASVVYGALMLVYVLLFAYLLSPLRSPRSQTIYDRIAGTVVEYA
mgnify:CR=1 FL=1